MNTNFVYIKSPPPLPLSSTLVLLTSSNIINPRPISVMGTFQSSQTMALLFFLFIAISTASPSSIIPQRTDEEVMALYDQWRANHGKLHNNLGAEPENRFHIFKDNLKYIDEINAQNLPYRLGLNVFADLTNEEYRSRYLGGRFAAGSRRNRTSNRYLPRLGDELPDSIDWRAKGAVAPVKDQGSCGMFHFSRPLFFLFFFFWFPMYLFNAFPIFTLDFVSFSWTFFFLLYIWRPRTHTHTHPVITCF